MRCFTFLCMLAAFFSAGIAEDCSFFKERSFGSKSSLQSELLKNISSCKNPSEVQKWLQAINEQMENQKLKRELPFLYVISVCNSYADMYFSIDVEGSRHYFLNGISDGSIELSPTEQMTFTWLLRTCSCEAVREHILPKMCPILAGKFDAFDLGFHAACLRSMFNNNYEYIRIFTQRNDAVKKGFYRQVFHEAMHTLANFKIFVRAEIGAICRRIPSSLSKKVRHDQFKSSIYDQLLNARFSPSEAYLYDRLKFYLIYGNELRKDAVSDEIYQEITQFSEGNILLRAFDKNIVVDHTSHDSIRKIFYDFVTGAHQYVTADSYIVLVGLYEFWNKSFSDKSSKCPYEITWTKLLDILDRFIKSRPGRPDLLIGNLVPDIKLKDYIAEKTQNFCSFLKNLYSLDESKKKDDEYLNCFLVKDDIIDLTLDWLQHKYEAKRYPFDREFAIAIFKILIKMPSVTFRIMTNKRKFIRYLSPHLTDGTFQFNADNTPLWNQDLHLFCQLFSDSQLQFTRNDILTPYFEAFDNCAVVMKKVQDKDGFVSGKFATNSEYQPVYEYHKLDDTAFQNLARFLSFFNGLKSDEIFAYVFDTIFVRKEPYRLSAKNIEAKITSELKSYGFDLTESANMITGNSAPFVAAITNKASLRNKIVIFLKLACTQQRNIISAIDMDRLELLLIRIPNSDLKSVSSAATLLKECTAFDDRLWKLYRTKRLSNMQFLGVQGLIRKWSLGRIKQEKDSNPAERFSNQIYYDLRKEIYGI